LLSKVYINKMGFSQKNIVRYVLKIARNLKNLVLYEDSFRIKKHFFKTSNLKNAIKLDCTDSKKRK